MSLRRTLVVGLASLTLGLALSTISLVHADSTWFNGTVDSSGVTSNSNLPTYPAPDELSPGIAGYVPYTNIFSPMGPSVRLTNSGSDVGLIVTQSKNKQVGAIWSQSPILICQNNHNP